MSTAKKHDSEFTVHENPALYIAAVRAGVPGKLIGDIRQRLNTSNEIIASIFSIASSNNVSREMRRTHLSKERSEEVLDVMRVLDKAEGLFDSARQMQAWMQTKNAVLSGAAPIEIMDTFEGRQWIMASLRAIEFGDFS